MLQKVVLRRRECFEIRRLVESGSWLLVYGRRKTGKTWLIRRCTPWGIYAVVTRSGECLLETGGSSSFIGMGECVRRVLEAVRRGGVGVIDEFQRMPERYWEEISLARSESEGSLILCGSSMGIVRRVFDRSSPLLGLLEAFMVDIVRVEDAIASLAEHGLAPREAVLWSVVARDPWILAHIEPRGEPWRVLAEHSGFLVPSVRGLIGEVFEEEERSLTRVYDAVLSLLAQGYWRAADIAARLYAARLVSSPSPGTATGVLEVLSSMGLVERVKLWRTRGARVYYRHRSSLTSLLYRIADYVEELGSPPPAETLRAAYGLELQFAIGELLAARHGLQRAYSIQPDGRDIDVVLLDRRGVAEWAYEVKMGRVSAGDVEWLRETAARLGVRRVGVVALEGGEASVDELLDAEALVEVAEKLAGESREWEDLSPAPKRRE